MTDSTNNNNDFNLQQFIDKVKAMVTPEKRALMMTKIKTAWAVFNEKPVNSKVDVEIKPVAQEKTTEENSDKSEKNKP